MKKIAVVALALFIAARGNRTSPVEMIGAGLGVLAGGIWTPVTEQFG